MRWLLALPMIIAGLLWGLRFRLRRLRMRTDEAALRQLQTWAELWWFPLRLEARLYWAEAVRRTNKMGAYGVLAPALTSRSSHAVAAHLVAAHWSIEDGRLGQADMHYASAVQKLAGPKQSLPRGMVHRRRAEIGLRDGRLDLAASELDAALADNPLDPESRLLRASLLFGRGQFDAAAADFAYLEANFGQANLRMRAALGASQIELLAGRHGRAISILDKVLADKPQQAEALVSRRIILQALGGDPTGAEQGLAQLGEPARSAPYVRASVAIGQKDWDAARRLLAEVLVRTPLNDPMSAEALWLLIGVLHAAGEPAQAADITERLKAVWPNSPYLTNPLHSQNSSLL